MFYMYLAFLKVIYSTFCCGAGATGFHKKPNDFSRDGVANQFTFILGTNCTMYSIRARVKYTNMS
jgi:hypothetical protein